MQLEEEYRRRVCRAIDFIHANLKGSPSVAEIAQAAPFSSFHFQRLFRAIVGESVADFTRRLRLEAAARRLRSHSASDITALAFDLGFSSSQNFAKAFRKHFHQSPTQYRDSAREGSTDEALHDRDITRSMSRVSVRAGSSSIQVAVRHLKSCRVVYRRHFGAYSDQGVQAAFDALARWADAHGLDANDRYIGIPWDDTNVTADEKCRFDACLIIPSDFQIDAEINSQIIPAANYAVFRCEVIHNDFDLPWTQLMRDWLPASGYQPADGPRLEVYHSDGTKTQDGRWQLEVCLPVIAL